MLTIAYIGGGKSAHRYHMPFSLKNENIRVKTIFSPVQNDAWEKVPGVLYTDNIPAGCRRKPAIRWMRKAA